MTIIFFFQKIVKKNFTNLPFDLIVVWWYNHNVDFYRKDVKNTNKQFLMGLRHGIPIGIGYFAVSFAFGIKAVLAGLNAIQAGLMSLTNITSAGQFAGIEVIESAKELGAGIISIILTQLIINLRYALMGFSLNQKLDSSFTTSKRAIVAFANTDEIFAVAFSRPHNVTFPYMLGLATAPIFGWTSGTVFGAIAGDILPKAIVSALGIALFGMFISIVMPHVRDEKNVRIVVLFAVILSCAFYYLPVLNTIESGLSIVVCTILSSIIGALLFPVSAKEGK